MSDGPDQIVRNSAETNDAAVTLDSNDVQGNFADAIKGTGGMLIGRVKEHVSRKDTAT